MSLKPPANPNSPLGSGRVFYNVQADYGARGNGSDDDSTPIQNAINAANSAGGGTVFFPRGTYKIGTTLTLKSNVTLLGIPGGSVLDGSTTAKVSRRELITATGTVGSRVLLSTDATKGLYSFDVASVSGLSAGDWVLVETTGVNYYPYAGGVNVDRAELKRIYSIAGTTLTFEEGLYDSYTVANSAAIRKVSFIENVTIDGLKFSGSNTAADQNRAIEFYWVNGFSIRDCIIENFDTYAIFLSMSIRGEVSGNRIRGVYYDGVTGTAFYAIACYDATQWVRVHNNHAERVRHLWVSSSQSAGSSFWGAPRFITVTGNTASNMEGGVGGRSWAFEHHGFGEGIVVESNTVDGCYGGFNARGPGIKFVNNIVRNWYQYALEVSSDITDCRDVVIEGNMVGARSVEGGGATTPVAVYADLTNATSSDLLIRGNSLELDKATGIGIQVLGAVEGKHLRIVDNTLRCLVAPSTWQIQITPNNALVERNKILTSDYGIRLLGTGITTAYNFMSGAAGAAGDGILSAASGQWIIGNYFKSVFNGIRLTAGADSSVVMSNVMDTAGDTRAYNIASTLTGMVVRNNNGRLFTVDSVASAATIVLPFGQTLIPVSGTADITAITPNGHAGRQVTLRFSGTAATNGVVDNGTTLNLASNFAYTPNDTLTLFCDGTNWYEVARSAN